MDSSKHTWTLEERMLPGHTKPTYFVRPAGDSVAVITKTQGREVAHLVAAAPELLEAVRGLIELSEDRAGGRLTLREVFGPADGRGCVLGIDVQYEGLNARAAIAKATGQQTT